MDSKPCPSRLSVATYQLSIKDAFDRLSPDEQLYAHHLSRAAWHGAKIILRQTSPEGTGIFDFILELHKACRGQWSVFTDRFGVTNEELNFFLDYAGMFMSKMNNFCGEGDRKIVPVVSADSLHKMASISLAATIALEAVIQPMLSPTPSALTLSESGYYLGDAKITLDEIAAVSRVMQLNGLGPENTRIEKSIGNPRTIYKILQASIVSDAEPNNSIPGSAVPIDITPWGSEDSPLDGDVRLVRGDHSAEMTKICDHLGQAAHYPANPEQACIIKCYVDSFRSGSLEAYRESMKNWVKDVHPRVESILGFVEPYRDPYGIRCEWRGVVSIADPQETAKLATLVKHSTKFIQTLPWAVPGNNDGKGPFEKTLFRAPDFSVVHALAFVCSNVWEASNVPNYNDIREQYGFKNIVYANRMSANADPNRPLHWISPSESQGFRKVYHILRFITTSIHELFGHGTGKLLAETSPGVFNFDCNTVPINTFTGKPIQSWYKPGQTWTSVFEKLAGTVEECRAMLISYYLAESKDMLRMYGYDDNTEIAADELLYNMYTYIGFLGLRALQAYNEEDQSWGSPHSNADFAILKHLLHDSNGLLSVDCDPDSGTLQIRVDRSKIAEEGKASLGRMLHRIHVWKCTADVVACKQFYEPLSAVEWKEAVWRKIVVSKPEPAWKFVQANTMLTDDGKVQLKVYEENNAGIIQSFADRDL
ncbi:dipeptidyl peptidase III [Xylaria telfairii]|nr:dipeptidyl peptidase III [Xylaria telfairii]